MARFLLDFKSMKMIVGKVRRSSVYYLTTKVGQVNEADNARSDVLGTVAVVILLVAVVGLVRLLVA